MGLYEKARKSPDKVEQIWSMARSQGLTRTWDAVQGKLSDHTPIGYSSSGVVIETDGQLDIMAGQRVACMGVGFANHAEYIVVPKNLAIPLPEGVATEHAAFGALACIAMQGIRRLNLSPGERVGVVGLGLIGQLALRLAAAMGYQVYGFDIDDRRVEHARASDCAVHVANSADIDPAAIVADLTAGVGLDGVVICASAKSDTVVNQAFNMCRRRGRISIVGDVGLKLERARMYAKELEVRLSCSYGPGRYDPDFELGGRDYPLPFARWTERRNLEFFIDLLAARRINISDLISARIDVERCAEAYSLIKAGEANTYGVLLDYSLPEAPALPPDARIVRYDTPAAATGNVVRVGLIGVGGYAKSIHIPNIQKLDTMRIVAVASKGGASAAVIAKKVKAGYATSETGRIFDDTDVDAVVISTRHASHAGLVEAALAAGKHVFVEKPMATTVAECRTIQQAQAESGRIVRVGFNRRFSPMLQAMKKAVSEGRRLFNIRVNVGTIGSHWSNTSEEGGRLMGEGVHFFDLANWMIGSEPVAMTAQFLGQPGELNPDASVSLRYADGSVANISYVTVGCAALGKEYFELFGNGRSVVIDDYNRISGYGCTVSVARKDRGDKGQLRAMEEFSQAVRTGAAGEGADALAGTYATAIAALAITAAREGREITLESEFAGTEGMM
jgi:predicted dehydrogenase